MPLRRIALTGNEIGAKVAHEKIVPGHGRRRRRLADGWEWTLGAALAARPEPGERGLDGDGMHGVGGCARSVAGSPGENKKPLRCGTGGANSCLNDQTPLGAVATIITEATTT